MIDFNKHLKKYRENKMARFDFTKVDDTDKSANSLLPEGTYIAKCIKCSSKSKGKTEQGHEKIMYTLTFQIEDEPHMGKKIYDRLFLYPDNPNTLKRMKNVMQSLCMDDIINNNLDFDEKDFDGRIVKVDVVHEVYNNKNQAKIDYNGYSKIEDEAVKKEVAHGSDFNPDDFDEPNF
jgi:hypothetical protein